MINSKTTTSGNDEANFSAISQQLCVSGGDFVCYDTVFFNFTKGELTKFMDFTFYLRLKMSQGSFGPGSVTINRLSEAFSMFKQLFSCLFCIVLSCKLSQKPFQYKQEDLNLNKLKLNNRHNLGLGVLNDEDKHLYFPLTYYAHAVHTALASASVIIKIVTTAIRTIMVRFKQRFSVHRAFIQVFIPFLEQF